MAGDKWSGPAFPEAVSADDLGGLNYSRYPGLEVRDYFAAHALTSVTWFLVNSGTVTTPEDLAQKAYELADAMIAARESA